jgi:hypothetical protein
MLHPLTLAAARGSMATKNRGETMGAARQPDPKYKENHEHPEHRATEDQVDMKDTIAQRIDRHGTKVEDLAGTGEHDSSGG